MKAFVPPFKEWATYGDTDGTRTHDSLIDSQVH